MSVQCLACLLGASIELLFLSSLNHSTTNCDGIREDLSCSVHYACQNSCIVNSDWIAGGREYLHNKHLLVVRRKRRSSRAKIFA